MPLSFEGHGKSDSALVAFCACSSGVVQTALSKSTNIATFGVANRQVLCFTHKKLKLRCCLLLANMQQHKSRCDWRTVKLSRTYVNNRQAYRLSTHQFVVLWCQTSCWLTTTASLVAQCLIFCCSLWIRLPNTVSPRPREAESCLTAACILWLLLSALIDGSCTLCRQHLPSIVQHSAHAAS